MKMESNIEYRIYRGENMDSADVDFITLKEVRQLLINPEPDILLIEKVKRFWESDGNLVNENTETLFNQLKKYLQCTKTGCKEKRLPGLNNYCYKHSIEFLVKHDPTLVNNFKKKYKKFANYFILNQRLQNDI